ncbi:unnamed protein product [Blepharisma stoltei]|uniref:Uncharacterized protein n=1 Tax=Blepharisma stoltei TaxID=1481888 RepID=A0AAU9ICG2_9CILI|nr:unnamed protein product [Blepharisma stoltei]
MEFYDYASGSMSNGCGFLTITFHRNPFGRKFLIVRHLAPKITVFFRSNVSLSKNFRSIFGQKIFREMGHYQKGKAIWPAPYARCFDSCGK